MQELPTGLFFLATILISAIFHEFSHGAMANYLGDPTAKNAGRLTLNPIPHIDPIGTILLPGLLLLSGSPFLFGWAKPVPYNPYNLRYQKWGQALVGAAGPLTNILIALVFSLIIRFTPGLNENLLIFFGIIVFANLILAIFNFIPIPPLDGSRLLFSALPPSMLRYQYMLERYGFVILLLFIFFGGGILSFLIGNSMVIAVGLENTNQIFSAL